MSSATRSPTSLGTGPPALTRYLSRTADVVSGAIALAAIAMTYWRLHFGIDFTDEAYYVAVPYRLIRGADVFVDTNAFAQGFVAVLIYPVLRLYYGIRGLTGIILFTRQVQFLFSIGVAVTIASALRGIVRLRLRLLAATVAILFVPFNIRGLSYDTLGSGFFTAGSFLGLWSLRYPDRRGVRIACGACLGLAVSAYPSFAGAAAVSVAIRTWLIGRVGRRDLLRWELPSMAVPLGGMAALILYAGVGRVIDDYRARTATTTHGAAGSLGEWIAHDGPRLFGPVVLLGIGLLLVAVVRGWRARLLPLLLVLPLLAISDSISVTSSLDYVGRLGVLAVPLYLLVRDQQHARVLFLSVWVPSLAGGLGTGLSSSNGGLVFGIGFFPATIVTTVLTGLAIERVAGKRLEVLAVVPAAAVVGLFVLFELGPSYRDSSLSLLDASIASGPYAGLTTSAPKKAFVQRLTRELSHVPSSCRILFFNDFPAGYLLTRALPYTNTTWMNRSEELLAARRALLRYYDQRHQLPEIVVEMKLVPTNLRARTGTQSNGIVEVYPRGRSALDAIGPSRYRAVKTTRYYAIYTDKQSACSL